jgi:glucose-1-phosphate cytidylyltransferase
MKAVILAGGLGTRLAEETDTVPKPMVEVGNKPLLWHIMKHLGQYEVSEFYVAIGYKGEAVKRYFLDLAQLGGDLRIDLKTADIDNKFGGSVENWTVNLIETGIETNTGGRVKKLRHHIGDEPFLLTYGDGVSNVDIKKLREFHDAHGKLVTVTAVRPPARFGGLEFEPGKPARFIEKPQMGEGWINGGFMIVNPEVFDLIEGDKTSLEFEVFELLSSRGEIMAYPHEGFWQCVDTLRELRLLRQMWADENAPWRTWSAE